jgi:hypothetical protein
MRYIVTTLFMLICFFIVNADSIQSQKENINKGNQIPQEDRMLMEYLIHLPSSEIGKRLNGVKVSAGYQPFTVLKGYIFLGSVNSASNNTHLYLFKKGIRKSAFVWVDKGGRQLSFPACTPAYQRKIQKYYKMPELTDENAYTVAGEVYTGGAVIYPNSGIVEVRCPTDEWVASIKKIE